MEEKKLSEQSEKIRGLAGQIRGLAAEGRAYNARISAASGPERHALRLEKAGVGARARPVLLAYAMLRGLPYRALERTCREDTAPYAREWLIRSTAEAAGTERDATLSWMDAGEEARDGDAEGSVAVAAHMDGGR